MPELAKKPLSREQALDYLFQDSIEDQFEALRLIKSKPEKRQGFMATVSQWFKAGKYRSLPENN
jgi:hypothetical protein